MNKRVTTIILATCLLNSNIHAETVAFDRRDINTITSKATRKKAPAKCCYKDSFIIEGRVAYFIPSSSLLANIYENGWINYGLQATYLLPIKLPSTNKLGVYSSFNYLQSSGYSLGGGQYSRIRILPLTVGLKYLYAFCLNKVEVDAYAALGARYNWINIHNRSDYVVQDVNPNGFGGVGEVGVLAIFQKYFLINAFMDYSIANVSSKQTRPFVYRQTLNISGFSVGGGLGVRF